MKIGTDFHNHSNLYIKKIDNWSDKYGIITENDISNNTGYCCYNQYSFCDFKRFFSG